MAQKKAEIDYSKRLKNWQYEQFCRAYLVTNNATQAAKDAKYSKKTAGSKGTHLLQIVSIAGRLAYLQGVLAKKSDIDAQKVIAEYSKIAFANIKDFLESGNEITDISQLPDEIAAAVDSIQCDIRHDSGESEGYTEKVKIKLHSKLGALNDLARHLGLFGKDNLQRQSAPPTLVIHDNRTQVAVIHEPGGQDGG